MSEAQSQKRKTGNRICNHPQAKARRAGALARKQISDNQTPIQRLQTLDDILGKNTGAKRERARLQAKISPKVLEQIVTTEDTTLTLNPELAAIHEQATGEVTVPVTKPAGKPFPFAKSGSTSKVPPAVNPVFQSPPVGASAAKVTPSVSNSDSKLQVPSAGSDKRLRKAERRAKLAQQDR